MAVSLTPEEVEKYFNCDKSVIELKKLDNREASTLSSFIRCKIEEKYGVRLKITDGSKIGKKVTTIFTVCSCSEKTLLNVVCRTLQICPTVIQFL